MAKQGYIEFDKKLDPKKLNSESFLANIQAYYQIKAYYKMNAQIRQEKLPSLI